MIRRNDLWLGTWFFTLPWSFVNHAPLKDVMPLIILLPHTIAARVLQFAARSTVSDTEDAFGSGAKCLTCCGSPGRIRTSDQPVNRGIQCNGVRLRAQRCKF